MSKVFEIGKKYRLANLSKGDGVLASALAAGIVGFPQDGVFTCEAIATGPNGDLVAFSTTEGVINRTYREGMADVPAGCIPAAFQEDLRDGVFELVEE